MKLPYPVYITLDNQVDTDLGWRGEIGKAEWAFIDAFELYRSFLGPEPVCRYRYAYPDQHFAPFAFPAFRLVVVTVNEHHIERSLALVNHAAAYNYRALLFTHHQLKNAPGTCMAAVQEALKGFNRVPKTDY